MNRRHANDTEPRMADDEPPAWPEENQALVRMYGQGLGDCFLLAFPRTRTTAAAPKISNGRPVFVLIDCGVIDGRPDAAARMKQIVRDIREETRDPLLTGPDGEAKGHLDLLIVTNGNPDHIAGFSEAREEWEGIQVDALWTAWTERDGADDVAAVLRRITAKQRQALSLVAEKAASPELEDRLLIARRLAPVLTNAPMANGERAPEPTGSTAIGQIAKERVPAGPWITCEPGDVRRMPGTQALAYVLGPPRDWDRLQPINPKKRRTLPDGQQNAAEKSGKAEMPASFDPAAPIRRYLDEPSALNAVVAPLLGPALFGMDDPTSDVQQADRDVYERTFPFDRRQRVPLATAEAAAVSFPEAYRALASYFEDVSHWRRIDYDWLASAESFALQVDTLINNTSLVLAIELPPFESDAEAKVLLFVSDAQMGNWMSWDDIGAWRPRDGARLPPKRPDVADLLRRTTFYKAGHHGADNATPREMGLDRLCTDGELTAFVPAGKDSASATGWPNMPRKELMDALTARTGSRVVMADGTLWDSAVPLDPDRPRGGIEVSPEMLRQERRDENGEVHVVETPLWVQMIVGY